MGLLLIAAVVVEDEAETEASLIGKYVGDNSFMQDELTVRRGQITLEQGVGEQPPTG